MIYFRSLNTLWFMLWMTVSFGQGVDFLTLDSDSLQIIDQEVHLIFNVKPGYHIQSNEPVDDLLIPTQLILEFPENIVAGEYIFPTSSSIWLDKNELSVLDGTILVKIPIQWEPALNNQTINIPLQISYQACDDRKCYFPRLMENTLLLRLVNVPSTEHK